MRAVRALNLVVLISIVLASACTEAPRPTFGGSCRWQPRPDPSFCNIAGQTPCDDWARSLTVSGLAVARCTPGPGDAYVGDPDAFRCANADRCDGELCYCGSAAECADGSACMRVGDSSYCIACDR